MLAEYTAAEAACGTPGSGSLPTSSGSTPRRWKEETLRIWWVLLTYAQCSLKEKEVFEQQFVEMLQRNELVEATYYGCREVGVDEAIHYHVLVNLGSQVEWTYSFAREKFAVEGHESRSLHLSMPRPKQAYSEFVENEFIRNWLKYVETVGGGDCFGERPCVEHEKRVVDG